MPLLVTQPQKRALRHTAPELIPRNIALVLAHNHARVIDLFQLADGNSDGHITRDELAHSLRTLGIATSQASDLFDRLCLDGSGLIQFRELKRALHSAAALPLSAQAMRRASAVLSPPTVDSKRPATAGATKTLRPTDRPAASLLDHLPSTAEEPATAQQLRSVLPRLAADRVCAALSPHAEVLAMHPHGSTVVAAAITSTSESDAAEQAHYSALLRGRELRLTLHAAGSRVMHAALQVLPRQASLGHAAALAGHIAECAQHSDGAARCVIALFERCTPTFVLDEIAAALPSLCRHPLGSSVVCSVVGCAAAAGIDLHGMIDACLARSGDAAAAPRVAEQLATDSHGAYVIEALLRRAPPPLRSRLVGALLPRTASLSSRSSHGARVAATLLALGGGGVTRHPAAQARRLVPRHSASTARRRRCSSAHAPIDAAREADDPTDAPPEPHAYLRKSARGGPRLKLDTWADVGRELQKRAAREREGRGGRGGVRVEGRGDAPQPPHRNEAHGEVLETAGRTYQAPWALGPPPRRTNSAPNFAALHAAEADRKEAWRARRAKEEAEAKAEERAKRPPVSRRARTFKPTAARRGAQRGSRGIAADATGSDDSGDDDDAWLESVTAAPVAAVAPWPLVEPVPRTGGRPPAAWLPLPKEAADDAAAQAQAATALSESGIVALMSAPFGHNPYELGGRVYTAKAVRFA